MLCLRPIVTRIPIGSWICPTCSGFTEKEIFYFIRIESGGLLASKDTKKRRRRTSTIKFRKKRRRLLTHIPSKDPARRLAQMRSLAMDMTSKNLEYNNELTYNHGTLQIRCKEALYRRGEFPPLIVALNSLEGYTVEVDGPINDMTLIAECAGDIDCTRNREEDDCHSIMTLLSSADASKSLIASADRLGNISRFISALTITQHKECVVLVVANRDIAKGERLYYDYNGCENEYPTH
ncbi:hypothetical protein MIMGU_mgv11b023084mg [Erythranthe guttata]|uniref:SET domain-containing protein n=1 Tax=Erythranthe guttata TaxID=4155 RepID=A0A022QSX2_ERYGU|nr:hypothetical protein MIMGU_mgv11b023084mg [Erythranthe guttata]